MAVVFVDMDKTLFDCNTGSLWVRKELRSGSISLSQATWAAWVMLRYSMGYGDLEHAFDTAAATVRGVREDDLAHRSREWFVAEVVPRVRPGAVEALRAHREAGDQLVLATSSSPYAGMPACEAFGLEALICTRLEVVEGLFTGRISSLAFGAHKLHRVREWASAQDVDLAQSTFYTDSYTDLALMEQVGRPVAVNPDRPLRREATARGWEVVDWGRS